MEAWLNHFVTQSVTYSLIVVMLVAFLESLALVDLYGSGGDGNIGALIGSGQLSLYAAWGAGLVGCLLGNWISYFIGWKFKTLLHNWSFLKKHQTLLRHTEHTLHQHPMPTIIIGRFVGPTRLLIPMVAGMLALPPARFALPNIIGCIVWPPVYFMPGILADVVYDIPSGGNSASFRWWLLGVAIPVWLAGWLGWRRWNSRKQTKNRKRLKWLTVARLHWLAPLTMTAAVAGVVMLLQHLMMPVYAHLLGEVVLRG